MNPGERPSKKRISMIIAAAVISATRHRLQREEENRRMEKVREDRWCREAHTSERRFQEHRTISHLDSRGQGEGKTYLDPSKNGTKNAESEGIWCTSQGLVGLVKYIKAENAGVLHFSGYPSLQLRGEIVAGIDEDTLFVSFAERPPGIADEELCKLLFKKLCQHTSHENKVRAACDRASRCGYPIPPEFLCPITLAVMHDPVRAADGCTYERDAIAHWIDRARRSPLTNLPLGSSTLVPDDELHAAIGQWARQVLSKADVQSI